MPNKHKNKLKKEIKSKAKKKINLKKYVLNNLIPNKLFKSFQIFTKNALNKDQDIKMPMPVLEPKFSIVKGKASNAAILKVNKISKVYGEFVALNQVSFEVKRGEIIGLIGGNGAGKTTLSEIIAGIVTPEAGTIKFGMDYKDSFKENIGMQFQTFDYPSGLSVKDIVAFARNLRKLNITNAELRKIMKTFRMEDFYRKKVNSLSGGQKQKLNILLSMIHNPDFLILDELSTGLDILAREEIISFTKNLLKKNKSSCILISHHMSEIEAICSRVIVLSHGKVVDDKKVADIKKDYKSIDEYMKDMIKSNTLSETYERKVK